MSISSAFICTEIFLKHFDSKSNLPKKGLNKQKIIFFPFHIQLEIHLKYLENDKYRLTNFDPI